ncbi:MAG: VanW family protein, partial [Oscillospiraceae bacterium]
EMVAKTTPPAVTSEMLTADLYSETLGSYNSDFGGSSAPRANNVRLASKKMNGTELMPGEVFSYNNIVGERSRANGFQAAPVFVGNKVESGLGGGVCQPSSTLYSAVLYANLEIVERNQHSLSVSYMPGGMDATVSYGSLDFRFKNNTPYPVKVLAIPDGGTLKCSILGYNPEKTSVQIVRSSNGSSFYVTRIVKKDGVEVSREKMPSSTYGVLEKSDPKKPN